DKSMYAYLINMGVRIVEMHRKLKETGSFYLHCDPTASHYLKIMLDAIFGKEQFRNEIIWCYKSRPQPKQNFAKKHDVIFFYTASAKYKFNWEEVVRPLSESTIKKYKNIDENARRYRLQGRGINGSPIKSQKDVAQEWEVKNPELVIRDYLDEKIGVALEDWWTDIDIINQSSNERLGYPTQKPQSLLERIIKASCPKGGTILDAYCGCGTTITAAQKLGMKWIGIDITYLAIDLIQQRLIDNFYLEGISSPTNSQKKKAKEKFLKDTDIFGIPKDLESAYKLAKETKGDYVRKEFEKWAVFSVGGVYSEKKGSDGGVDGYFYIYDADKNDKVVKKQCYIQVKSGKVGIKDIRDFDSTLGSLDSPIGIFITLEEVTKPMLEYIASLKKYTSTMGRIYDRITIITIEDIIAENVPDFAVRATKKANAVENSEVNGDLFLDLD
ncbi:MAG: DNA methyltransferase, partial [Pseudomonadota bacterium]